jgi:outer membrane protein insertion porin family
MSLSSCLLLKIFSRGTVLSYLPVEVGDDYTEKTSKEIISSLYKTQFFKDIEVSEVNQTLKITVTLNISDFKIEITKVEIV